MAKHVKIAILKSPPFIKVELLLDNTFQFELIEGYERGAIPRATAKRIGKSAKTKHRLWFEFFENLTKKNGDLIWVFFI